MRVMARVLLLIGIIAFVSPLFGQTSSPSAAPSLEQRIVDLEAYVNNSAARQRIPAQASPFEHRRVGSGLQRMDDDMRSASAFHDNCRAWRFFTVALSARRTSFRFWRNASALLGWSRFFGGQWVTRSCFRAGVLSSED